MTHHSYSIFIQRIFRLIFFIVIFSIALLLGAKSAQAQVSYPEFSKSGSSTVKASVGRFYLSVTGYQSPFASVVLTTKSGQFLRSTVADKEGYFTLTDILITQDFNGFCLTAVDFKRIGESEACIDITTPITEDLSYKDIFLPPTIGLSKKVINAGENAEIYGYTMPFAKVYLSLNDEIITLTADSTGFYRYLFKNVPAGSYTFSAAAELNGKKSLPPTKKVTLEARSLVGRISEIPKEAAAKLPLSNIGLILLALLLLIAIGILLYKLRFKLWVIIVDKFRKRHRMHHDWFLDAWDKMGK